MSNRYYREYASSSGSNSKKSRPEDYLDDYKRDSGLDRAIDRAIDKANNKRDAHNIFSQGSCYSQGHSGIPTIIGLPSVSTQVYGLTTVPGYGVIIPSVPAVGLTVPYPGNKVVIVQQGFPAGFYINM